MLSILLPNAFILDAIAIIALIWYEIFSSIDYSYKSEYVSRHRQAIGWLSVPLLTQHHTLCAMLDQPHIHVEAILLNLPIKFDAITLILY